MRIALTGATGFLGRYLLQHLHDQGHDCRCWFRPRSDLSRLEVDSNRVQWITGALGDRASAEALVDGVDAVVHSALHHPGGGFRGGEGDLLDFVDKNIGGTLQLIEAARAAGVGRFIFISTCAVHEEILGDRPLDEAHVLWPKSHYGAHKAALEMFVHSYGLGQGYEICALRPTGIYGLAHPIEKSKWYDLVGRVVRGETVDVAGGGKEVHAADVARATALLLTAPRISGQCYNCYDQYISAYDVASTAREISGSAAEIVGSAAQPKHQIETGKLQELGMRFGGWPLFEETIGELVEQFQAKADGAVES